MSAARAGCPIRSRDVCAALAAFALVGGVARAQQPAAGARYATPAIDYGVYREGEVRRLDGRFGRWRASCDEIARLRQRFCSLFSEAADAAGRPLASVVVSTGDDGKPAVLLRLGVSLPAPQSVDVSPEPASAPHPTAPLRLKIAGCDASGCVTLWRPTPEQLDALSDGRALRLRIASGAAGLAPAEATIDGAGFHDALAATTRPDWRGDDVASELKR